MRLFAHSAYILKGYTRLNHEAIIFEQEQVKDVSEEVGAWLLGAYPGTFCHVRDNALAQDHRCPRMLTAPIMHREMDAPPYDTQVVTKRRGWPKGKPRKVAA